MLLQKIPESCILTPGRDHAFDQATQKAVPVYYTMASGHPVDGSNPSNLGPSVSLYKQKYFPLRIFPGHPSPGIPLRMSVCSFVHGVPMLARFPGNLVCSAGWHLSIDRVNSACSLEDKGTTDWGRILYPVVGLDDDMEPNTHRNRSNRSHCPSRSTETYQMYVLQEMYSQIFQIADNTLNWG